MYVLSNKQSSSAVLFDHNFEVFNDKQLIIMSADQLSEEILHLDSKNYDCVTAIFDEHSFFEYLIMEKVSHLFGTHIVYGKNITIDPTYYLLFNALLNKPIVRYSKDQVQVGC